MRDNDINRNFPNQANGFANPLVTGGAPKTIELEQGTRVNQVIETLEQTVDEMVEAHNRLIDEITQVIGGNTEQYLVDPNMIDARPVADRTPPLAIRLDSLHSKMQRLLIAQIEARAAVRL